MRSDELWVSERFVSLQGEGASVGCPAAFLRLGLCNLSCSWCDTPYTWDFSRYEREQELTALSMETIVSWLLESNVGRLIITGGEPLVQHKKLVPLLAHLDREQERAGAAPWVVEVETNGTLLASEALYSRVDQWNISPKLASSEQEANDALKHEALRAYREHRAAYLKFVIASPTDHQQAVALVDELAWPKERVLFMPEARSAEELEERSPAVARAALSAQVRFSSRLHLQLYGGKRGT